MKPLGNLAIVGCGPTAIYLLRHIANHASTLAPFLASITILERTSLAGFGMPYHPETTDIYNMSNISSEEIPALPKTFFEWLLEQDAEKLREWQIDPDHLSESEVYPRLPLGAYFHAQYTALISSIRAAGIPISEKTRCNVEDIVPGTHGKSFDLEIGDGARMRFDSIVIATGHAWKEEDDQENGYYGSPWPISKILPSRGNFHNICIGTLGASLSAFDVVSSLSHRHGEFRQNGDGMSYHPFPDTDGFRIAMHAANGWLPHLQFDQDEPFRAIYRHVSREEMLALRDEDGRIRIEAYFDKVCRPVLVRAFSEDGLGDVSSKLGDPEFTLEDFVEFMEDKHEFSDAFTVMRKEMKVARDSVENHRPVHWMEVMDDLMFTLNFHAELMPAEDHLVFRKTVMPFLMSVIAAMPLPSARMLFALHDAGKLEVVTGRVSIKDRSLGKTTVSVVDGKESTEIAYEMFIDCSGQKPMDLDEYPFQSLVKAGRVRKARARFVSPGVFAKMREDGDGEHLFDSGGVHFLHTGGVDIDSTYRVIAANGEPDSSIFDLAFPHTSGVRPYSYGLQACDATAKIVITSWIEAIAGQAGIRGDLDKTSKLYEDMQD